MNVKKTIAAVFLVALAVFSTTTGALARESTGCKSGTGNGAYRGAGGTDCLSGIGIDAGGESSNDPGYGGGGHQIGGGGCGYTNTPGGQRGSC